MAVIILIDDDLSVRKGVSRILAGWGHTVRVAETGKEALSLLDSGPVDLVLSDINMPDMDGIEVITKLREKAPELPVVAMSGGGLFDKALLLDNALMLGALATIEKPFTPGELKPLIDEALAGD